MIKLGQIGLNYGLNVHIPAFSSDPRFKLVGVCSSDLSKCSEIKNELGLDYATNNPEELFSLVDAVSIAVPPKQQAIILPRAIERGLHVFFEKPLGYLPKDNIKLQKEQSLMVDFEFMEVDVWKELKELILSNKIGEILHAEIIWNVETYAVSRNINSWKTDPDLSGGVLNNFGPHCFHYIEEFMGKISYIDVKAMNYLTEAEEVVYIYLKFLSGSSASICISSNTFRGSGHFLEFTGRDGTASLKNYSESTLGNFFLEIFCRSGQNIKKESSTNVDNNIDDRVPAVRSLVKKFGDWIEKGELQSPNIRDAMRVQKLLESSRKSILLNQEVIVKD